MKSRFLSLSLSALAALSFSTLGAEEFQGADAILKQVAQQKEKAGGEKKANPAAELREKAEAFETASDKLPPDEAAAQWLTLFDAYAAIPSKLLHQRGDRSNRLSMGVLVSALPGPEAWDALAAAINARARKETELRDGSLSVFASILRGDREARQKSIAALGAAIENQEQLGDYERTSLIQELEQITQTADALTGSPSDRLAAFAKELTERESNDEKFSHRRGNDIDIPDLVGIGGKEAAAPLIQRALRLSEDISVKGKATRRLAAQLALKEIAELKKPVWTLVEGPEDIPLYEALAKKFPKKGGGSERGNADAVYLLSLIATNRTDEAASFATGAAGRLKEAGSALSSKAFRQMQREGFGAEVLAFLREMLTRDPGLPFWDDFITLSAQESRAPDALRFLREAMQKPNLTQEAHAEVRSRYYAALLAADEVDEGVRILSELVQAGPVGKGRKSAAAEAFKQLLRGGLALTSEKIEALVGQADGGEDSARSTHGGLALQLAKIGVLLERPDLIDKGLAAAQAGLAQWPATDSYQRRSFTRELIELLLDLNRSAEAEKLAAAWLIEASVPRPNRTVDARDPLVTLTSVYHRAGRQTDVIRLLDDAPFWNVSDLAHLGDSRAGETPLLVMAAQAFAATDRKDEARRAIRRTVQENRSHDPAYALLLQLGGDDVEAFLDRISNSDRFEERPLIWKAKLQFDAGRFDEAEKTIRAAIAIDPSDGEKGKGDRMRAYAVLGDVLEKKGDEAQAKLMRGAVEAIRLSEQADDWWSAGLLSRAVRIYEDALLKFADAYCIQSRLALRYSELGEFGKAEQHYQRAYELMPESFGRVESHCFGCEGAFKGERAQGIAEKVFSSLAVKLPDRAQVFYLLGYLRSSQERFDEAAELFRKAVKLDPDYLNAWDKLQDLAEETTLPPAELETAALAVFRLDPAGHHAQAKLEGVSDLRKLWSTIRATDQARPARESGPLYPLAAARVELERRGRAGPADEWVFSSRSDSREDVRRKFAEHSLIAAATSFLERTVRRQ